LSEIETVCEKIEFDFMGGEPLLEFEMIKEKTLLISDTSKRDNNEFPFLYNEEINICFKL
jgi:sulfatase maturation enzyme AslB (radical SAM superfamily)